MNDTVKKSFKIKDGQLVHETVTEEALRDTGCIFLALPLNKEKHLVYKLHAFRGKSNDDLKYHWLGLWNSCSVMSPFQPDDIFLAEKNGFKSIENAIKWIMRSSDYTPIKTNFSKLISEHIVNGLLKEKQ